MDISFNAALTRGELALLVGDAPGCVKSGSLSHPPKLHSCAGVARLKIEGLLAGHGGLHIVADRRVQFSGGKNSFVHSICEPESCTWKLAE